MNQECTYCGRPAAHTEPCFDLRKTYSPSGRLSVSMPTLQNFPISVDCVRPTEYQPRLVNHSGMTLADVERLPVVGLCHDERFDCDVVMYKLNGTELITKTISADGSMTTVLRQARNLFPATLSMWPKTHVITK